MEHCVRRAHVYTGNHLSLDNLARSYIVCWFKFAWTR